MKSTTDIRIVFVGAAYNISTTIEQSIRNILKLCNLCRDYHIVMFENDSTDGTLDKLQKLSESNARITILTETGITDRFNGKTKRLAYVRNKLKDFVLDKFSDFEYMVVFDPDNESSGHLNIKTFQNVFRNDKWDVISFNKNPYYDIWALRTYAFNKNIWNQYPGFLQNRKNWQSSQSIKTQVMKKLKIFKFYPVISAFGGFAIYKTNQLRGCEYNGDNTETVKNIDCDCEHVAFHKQMTKLHSSKHYICNKVLFVNVEKD